MLITRKTVICKSQPHEPHFARNADVHYNLNVSNPVPKVYTIYGVTLHAPFRIFSLRVCLVGYDPFVKMPPATKWYLSLVEERVYMFDVPSSSSSL